jgi:PPOX class probable F420-dependent enzyme
MAAMSEAEWRAFVTEATRTAAVATVRADGRPHVAPVWFLLDGDEIVFTTGRTTVKGRTLARDGRVALCVQDETPPYAYVIVEGIARLTQNPPDMLAWTTRIAARYMGDDQAEAYGRRNADPSECLVRVAISRVLAEKDLASW